MANTNANNNNNNNFQEDNRNNNNNLNSLISEKHAQSQYGSIELTAQNKQKSKKQNGVNLMDDDEDEEDERLRDNGQRPPKPALRQKTLQKRLSKNLAETGEPEPDDSIKKSGPQIGSLSLSMSQVRQQQAINRELAERHKSQSLKRTRSTGPNQPKLPAAEFNQGQGAPAALPAVVPAPEDEATKGTDQGGFQNAAFDPSEAANDLDLQKIAAKNIDQNPLSLLIKRPSQTAPPSEPEGGPGEVEESELRPYPRKVFFIVANEFCERFSYYGLRTVLVLYFKSVLGMSDSSSTVNFHMFAALCYLTPVLGAILGDSVWGKFHTILYLSLVYFLGELVLVASALLWQSGPLSHWLTLAGLLLIGLGTGGIKPCVSAFGGDQFLPSETKRRASFFSIFYASINAGSLVSMFVTPMLRSDVQCAGRLDCYPLAFGLPCALMLISIISFLLAKNHYTRKELPEKNVIVAFARCVCLALKRKLIGPRANYLPHEQQQLTTATTTNSNGNSNENINGPPRPIKSHWIYLASDQFDPKSLEDFRAVLGILLLFVPVPVYWCLFDQQGSMWTLQAARMDGRLPGTSFIIQPDQVSVANPILLLAAIPAFEFLIYPAFRRYKVFKGPVSRISLGGFLAALTFAVSAAIQFQIQASSPALEPARGQASLSLVNGLADCRLVELELTHVHTLLEPDTLLNSTRQATPPKTTRNSSQAAPSDFSSAESVLALANQLIRLRSRADPTLNNYRIRFRVASGTGGGEQQRRPNPKGAASNNNRRELGCGLDPAVRHELSVAPLDDQAKQLLYIEQGNGKLKHHQFNESWQLPEANMARVVLLFESFGSLASSGKRKFSLLPPGSDSSSPGAPPANVVKQANDTTANNNHLNNSSAAAATVNYNEESNEQDANGNPSGKYQFGRLQARLGSVHVFEPLDFEVPPRGLEFSLQTTMIDSGQPDHNKLNSKFTLVNLAGEAASQPTVHLRPGTRNLIVVHQASANVAYFRHSLIQDNTYRINILWQLIPYLMISMSEVLFSITGLEFSYSVAPDTMKSVILAAWFLTTAVGNLLTVAVEALHPFSNVAYDFLFYAMLMAADMLLFMYIGLNFKPYSRDRD